MSNIELNPPGQIFRCSVFKTGFTPSLFVICIYIYIHSVLLLQLSAIRKSKWDTDCASLLAARSSFMVQFMGVRREVHSSSFYFDLYICSGFCGVCERNIGWCLAQVICIACIQEGDGLLWYQFVIPTTVYITLNTSVFGPFQLTLKLLVLFLPLQSV
jgi:hypothetical protein